MAQKTINVTCNQVNKRVNNNQVRFNIDSDEGNAGNINISANQKVNPEILSDFEPGKEYQVIIKEA